ncbi:MAG TPA: hypothetical protein VMU04_07860 [Candidatus Acidoferrum sp.]|nr:hypothetical protein [Candidatus Acidoferrum sp.]
MNRNIYQQTEAQDRNGAARGGEPQLELALAAGAGARRSEQGSRRRSRASWWFQRMRQAVDRACDWQPVPVPPPEQIWFRDVQRTVSLGADSSTQRQLCE